ncbi:MAG: hypothetical protein ACK55Z_36095 [bacterium]
MRCLSGTQDICFSMIRQGCTWQSSEWCVAPCGTWPLRSARHFCSARVSLFARQVDAACVRVWGVGIYLLCSLLFAFSISFPPCLMRLSPWYYFFSQAFVSLVVFCFLFRGTFLPMKYKKIVEDRQKNSQKYSIQ